jgi:hypothetical protein
MELIYWLLIGTGILFVLMFVLIGIILYRVSVKNKIRINILLKSRQWLRFKLKLKKINKEILYNKGNYIFDDRGIIKGKYCDNIYYYEGNPEPIIFDFQHNIPKVQAQDLQTILDSDLIEKLFSEKRLQKLELLLIIVLIITALTLLAVGGGFFVTPNIASEGNAEFIANVTRTVIRGG